MGPPQRPAGGKTAYAGNNQPCTDKLVRLRLQRTGDQLAYLWAVGVEGGAFKKLNQRRFGADDVKQVRLLARTEGPYNVDVRLLDLGVRSVGAAQAEAKAPVVEPPPVKPAPDLPPPSEGSKTWLLAALLLGLALPLILALGLGAWLFLRRAGSPSSPVQAEPPSLSFACPKCARVLKTRPELAGKKVKCALCGTTALVPSIPAGKTRDTS